MSSCNHKHFFNYAKKRWICKACSEELTAMQHADYLADVINNLKAIIGDLKKQLENKSE